MQHMYKVKYIQACSEACTGFQRILGKEGSASNADTRTCTTHVWR